jgi:heme/copper-type cytochrome/quinol oxidase subunit 2
MDIWLIGIPLIGLMIVAMAVYRTWTINKTKKSGYPIEDERTAKIQGKAYKACFFLGVFYLIALNFYNIINIEFLRGAQLESMLVINSALIVIGVSVIVLKTYLERKEDV